MWDESSIIIAAAYGSGGIGPSSNFKDVVVYLVSLINAAVPVLATLALVIFFLGLVRYVGRTAGTHEREVDKQVLWWGLIALFVLFSVWGILRLLCLTFLGDVSCSTLGSTRIGPFPTD